MPILDEKISEPLTELPETNSQDHDLVHELSKRLDALCRCAECIADAEGDPELQQLWRDLERIELANIRQLKAMIINRIERGIFLNDL